ncbi:unnamed protein product, partial [marine sediment metagenome]
GRRDDSVDIEDIITRDRRELGYGVGNVIEKSSYKIINETDVHYLEQEIMNITDVFLNKIAKGNRS